MSWFILIFLVLAILTVLLLVTEEPPTPQQRATEIVGRITLEKDQATAEIHAASAAYKQQMIELFINANRQVVEDQMEDARRQARQAVEQAKKE